MRIGNPDLPADQAHQLVDRFNTMLKAEQSTFTTKIGSIRYSAVAEPEMGIWMVANLRPVLAPSTWFGNWREKLRSWVTKKPSAN